MAVADRSIISYYKYDVNADDSLGTNDGTVNGATLTTSSGGVINEAYIFDGTNDYIDLNFSCNLTAAAPISIGVWFKTSSGSRGDIVGVLKEAGAQDPIMIIYTNVVANKVGIQIKGDGGTQLSTSGTTTINDGNWHHILLVLTTTTQKLYLDGNATPEISGTTNTGDITLVGEDFFNGASNIRGSPSSFLNGNCDELGIWDEELSAADASELYNSGSGLSYPFGVAAVANDAVFFSHNF